MKLRIKKDSLTLRLSAEDITEFAEKKTISETLQFPAGNSLLYNLQAAGAEFSAEFSSGTISVTIPETAFEKWLADGDIGIETEMGLLRITVEKDLERRKIKR